ncbi:5-hydroxytryptamine receptor 3A-like [Rhinichthys klamathensis goyatoka]|uniref:5-hydroxytryptamine receptor 3A-like n=1 Tax=Rhinichthys klamathensis goyatoka TaxID=3034132 RepID=UPI0024B5F9A5|nr:5-hydroxytryptamine receptor 3A-like [Rhinichthys klamathensis goyatoka]
MWPMIFTYFHPVNIFVDLYVTSIINVDEKAQSLTTQIKILTHWPNWNMQWNKRTFCGIETFVAPKNMFWTPDISIMESIRTEFGTKESPNLLLFNYGAIVSADFLSLTTACKMDLYRFPFDAQSCYITFQSTVYSGTSETQKSVLTNKHKITWFILLNYLTLI